jgi:hypothetical protein
MRASGLGRSKPSDRRSGHTWPRNIAKLPEFLRRQGEFFNRPITFSTAEFWPLVLSEPDRARPLASTPNK